ncbi:hypothetical protein O3P69_002872 [Scylla paramamosain]|uniref:Chitin-binding type-2 domain-containing protein n=1 Tax=Scylla paramamosain TaxID=85552 RepID=A0AAW0UMY1_SCYPA
MWVSTLLFASLFCPFPPPPPPSYQPPECPSVGTHHFHDERLCEAYYLCTGGERTHLLCPEGEVYNLDTPTPGRPHATCVSAANGTCILSYPYDVFFEPPECPAQGLHYFRDERICDGFYECIDGVREHRLCPTGELFSPADPATPCADAADVVCPTLPPLVPLEAPECGGLSWKHLPDPDDCSAFFECRGGEASWRSCTEDLLYNAHSPANRYPCDYPFNVQCGAPHAPPVPPPRGPFAPVPPPRGPFGPVQPPRGPFGPVQPPRGPFGPVQPPRGPFGPVPPPRAPSGPVPPSNNSTKVFNFYTYVTHNW